MIKFLQTPGQVKKYVLGGILVFICLAMVTYLIPGFTSGGTFSGSPGVLAKVDGDEITYQDVQQTAKRMLRQQYPQANVPPFMMSLYMQQALEQLIMQRAALGEADRMGLKVSDQSLRDYLQKSPYFFPNGQFIGQQAYESMLQQAGMTVSQFEFETKKDIQLQMLRNIVEGPATVSEKDMQEEYTRRNTKVKFEYAVLTLDDIQKQIKPTDSELKAFYEANKDQYKNANPEKRKADYIVIDPAKLQVQVSQQDLQSYYNQHRDEFRVPDEVTLRQILIKTPQPGPDGKVDQKAVDTAKVKAQDVLNKLKAGGNFAELAKKYSEDAATANNGGLLGAVRRGQTMPEIDKAAFSMNKGQTSDVIQTPLGFFILQVAEKQSAHLKTLEEVKPQIEPIIAREKAAGQAENLATRVQSDARTSGLQAAAQKNGLQVVNSGFVTGSDALPWVGVAPEFMQALFQAKENTAPEMVRTSQGYVVFQVVGVQPPTTPTFEEIKPRVEAAFKSQRAGMLLAQKMQQLSDRARAEHNLKAAAKEVGATVKTSELVDPQGQVPDIGSMTGPASVVFTMKPGDISAPINAGQKGIVISLLDKQAPPPAEFASKKDQIREELVAQKRGELMNLFITNLVAKLEKEKKIVRYQNEINKLMPKGGLGSE